MAQQSVGADIDMWEARPKRDDPRLSPGEGLVIDAARQALIKATHELTPAGSSPHRLALVAIVGLFADTISGLTFAPALIEVVNKQLTGAGLEVVRTRRS
jgi:hypothetical protein